MPLSDLSFVCIAGLRTQPLLLGSLHLWVALDAAAALREVWDRSKTVKALRKVPLFSKLTKATIILLEKWLSRRSFQDGDFLIKQGDIGTTFYLARRL